MVENLLHGSSFRLFEQQMLYKMSHTVFALFFISGTGIYNQTGVGNRRNLTVKYRTDTVIQADNFIFHIYQSQTAKVGIKKDIYILGRLIPPGRLSSWKGFIPENF